MSEGQTHSRNRCKGLSMVCMASVILGSALSWAQTLRVTEDEGKAAFIYHFTLFIAWPAHAVGPQTGVFDLCVFNAAEVTRELQYLTRGKSFGTHALKVRQIHDPKETASCNVLYLGHSSHETVNLYLESVHGKPILTVSDHPDFCSDGGAIAVLLATNRLRFVINPRALERAHLTASSKLLQLAEIADEGTAAGGAAH